ncbi:type VI secretion system baseplate subunit TssE [Ewingella americana]
MPSLLCRLSDNHPRIEKDDYRTEEKSTWLLNELKMLFSSRSRFSHIEIIPLVNASILNYGIDESVSQIHEVEHRKIVIEERIKNALQRFEPRLTEVDVITRTDNPSSVMFEINAMHKELPIKIELVWDDCTGKFYFNE